MQRRRRNAFAGAVFSALTLVACGGHTDNTADQGRSVAEQAGLSKDVADFFALATRGAQATYRSTLSTTDAKAQPLQVTTTQRPPDLRLDVFHADGTIDSTITVEAHSYQCTMAANHWDCGDLGVSSSSDTGVFSPTVIQAAISTFRERAADYDFRVEDRSLVGTSARCLVTTLKAGRSSDSTLGATGTLCLSSEGAVLLIQTPAGSVTATQYTTTIPGDAFTLPAPVESTTTTGLPASSAPPPSAN